MFGFSAAGETETPWRGLGVWASGHSASTPKPARGLRLAEP